MKNSNLEEKLGFEGLRENWGKGRDSVEPKTWTLKSVIRQKTCHGCALVTSSCTWVQMTLQVSGYTRVIFLKMYTRRSGVVPCTQGKVCKLGQGLARLLGWQNWDCKMNQGRKMVAGVVSQWLCGWHVRSKLSWHLSTSPIHQGSLPGMPTLGQQLCQVLLREGTSRGWTSIWKTVAGHELWPRQSLGRPHFSHSFWHIWAKVG